MKSREQIILSLNGGEGLKHFSFSQLRLSIGMWIVDYMCRSQEQRRSDRKNYRLGFGSVCSNVVQEARGKYIYDGDKKRSALNNYDKAFKKEYSDYLLNPYDELDKEVRENITDKIHSTAKNIDAAVTNIFSNKDLTCERYVDMFPKDLWLGFTGRLDYEIPEHFAECKTKPPKAVRRKKGLGFNKQQLPKEPDPYNIDQVAFYRFASGKEPFLFYANEDDFIIFDNTHPALYDDHLEYCLNQLFNKAKTIQRLLSMSNGEPEIMAQFVEKPSLTDWKAKELSMEQIEIINKLWR